MTSYYFYARNDKSREPIYHCKAWSRLGAAEKFAEGKRLPLKTFLTLFAISRPHDETR